MRQHGRFVSAAVLVIFALTAVAMIAVCWLVFTTSPEEVGRYVGRFTAGVQEGAGR